MGKIVLYDNDYEGAILCVGDKKDSADLNHVSQKDLDNLLKYANRSLGDIIKKDNLLMFPMFHDKTQATLLELPLLTIQDHQYLGQKCKSLRVKTGNLMGFIGFNGTELEIRSRFFPNRRRTRLLFILYASESVPHQYGEPLTSYIVRNEQIEPHDAPVSTNAQSSLVSRSI